MILHGNCLEKMKELDENSVDAIVTDPPYGLKFMGKKWDYKVPSIEVWKEVLRILKPGGFLLSFAGTRTYHRMVVNIEDAGFEIRDMISWLYGSGFPKSLNIGKQIDKIQGNEREELEPTGRYKHKFKNNSSNIVNTRDIDDNDKKEMRLTKGNSEWEGWGTALKPACEPIVVARKPLSEKNVALNVLKHGTGGINIDECRVPTDEVITNHSRGSESAISKGKYGDSKAQETHQTNGQQQGRFPANIILDEEAGKMLDEQSGISKSEGGLGKSFKSSIFNTEKDNNKGDFHFHDKGGASRFFYCAKASKSERNLGCEELEEKYQVNAEFRPNHMEKAKQGDSGKPHGRYTPTKNNHPTVKPIKLMEYLVKLVSREGATVLDPFLGSGTTAIACVKLNRKWIGIEREEEYIKIIEARLKPFTQQNTLRFAESSGGEHE